MSEEDLQKQLACKFAEVGYGRLWINDNGLGYRKSGRGFKYGLGKGTSDLIGFTDINGQAVFTAFEVKMPTGRASKEQLNFIKVIQDNGGISAIVRSWEDIEEVIKKARQ